MKQNYGKRIKHENILNPNPGPNKEGYNYMPFVARGCSMTYRKQLWYNFTSSIVARWDRENDNSYITFEEEPGNPYDPNAIMLMCRGEFFGTMGYVGKEHTTSIKEILATCEKYRVDMIDEENAGDSVIPLLLTWK